MGRILNTLKQYYLIVYGIMDIVNKTLTLYAVPNIGTDAFIEMYFKMMDIELFRVRSF